MNFFFKILFLFIFQDGTLEEEMAIVRRTESNINHIMAHHSPVLIIQRHFRGILTRKRYVKKREK